jgi:hypothetical protein
VFNSLNLTLLRRAMRDAVDFVHQYADDRRSFAVAFFELPDACRQVLIRSDHFPQIHECPNNNAGAPNNTNTQ